MLEGKYWKNGVPQAIKLIHSRKMSKQKQSENAGKKKNVKEKWIEKKPKEKRVEMKDEEKQGRKTKAELVPHTMKNDPCSDHPETQFGPTYPFFRNPEPRPILRTVKVHFDWTWILRLKRFFLKEFSSKIILINHPPIWGEFWIFKYMIGLLKKKEKKKMIEKREETWL